MRIDFKSDKLFQVQVRLIDHLHECMGYIYIHGSPTWDERLKTRIIIDISFAVNLNKLFVLEH